MATITHQYANSNVRTNFLGGQTGISYLSATVSLTAAEVANGNVVEFFRLPADAVIVDGYIKSDELDSNGTPTLTVEVGHDGDVDAFVDSATHTTAAQIVRAGGTAQFGAGTPLLPRDPTDPVQNDNDPFTIQEGTVIKATFNAAAATAAAGKLSLVIGFVTMPNH